MDTLILSLTSSCCRGQRLVVNLHLDLVVALGVQAMVPAQVGLRLLEIL
jgi:hypothetical protein